MRLKRRVICRERERGKGGRNCYGLTAGHAAYEQCVPMRRMSNAQSINLISNSDNIAHFESDSGCKSALELMATNKTKRNIYHSSQGWRRGEWGGGVRFIVNGARSHKAGKHSTNDKHMKNLIRQQRKRCGNFDNVIRAHWRFSSFFFFYFFFLDIFCFWFWWIM